MRSHGLDASRVTRLDIRRALREARSNGLLYEENAREVGPAELIRSGQGLPP